MRRFDLGGVLSSPAPALVASLAATLTHAVVITSLVPALTPDTLGARAALTWAAIMVPGLVVIASSRAARRRWWRPVALWALMYTAFGPWPLMILIVGQTWWLWRALQEAGANRAGAELEAAASAIPTGRAAG